MGEKREMEDIVRMAKGFMEENNISCCQMASAVDKARAMAEKEGKDIASDGEWEKYKEFKEKGNEGLEVESIGGTWTRTFAYGIETLRALFGDIDLSKPFRVIVDYNPEQPKTIVRKYWTKEDYESYIGSIQDKMKD